MVELSFGRVEIVGVARVEAGQFGIFAFGISAVVGLEIRGSFGILFVFIVAQAEQIEGFFGFFRAFKLGYDILEKGVALGVAFLFEGTLCVFQLLIRVGAFQHLLIFAATGKRHG